jgi:uncharacterized protein
MMPALRHEIVGPADSPHRLRIAHLSDFHLWFSERKLVEIEPLLSTWQPDVLALTGDYADTPTGRRLALSWIRKMAALYPLCWVAGNHDHWFTRSFIPRLEALPQAHPIDRRDAWIEGKSGHRFRFTSWAQMTAPAPGQADHGATIVLLHDPALIAPEKLRDAGSRLLLAGHLHGGQITLWRDRLGRPQPAAACYRWLADRSQIHASTLIVSRGLGDTLPLRLRAPKEIVLVDFYADLPRTTRSAGLRK